MSAISLLVVLVDPDNVLIPGTQKTSHAYQDAKRASYPYLAAKTSNLSPPEKEKSVMHYQYKSLWYGENIGKR